MVTGKNDVIDRVVGLEVGADDYITKPFHVREVIARIRSVLRRAGENRCQNSEPVRTAKGADPDETLCFCFDNMTAVPGRLELMGRDGERCDLTSGEFKLLEIFLERPKRVLSRDQLMDFISGQERSPLDRTIDNQIARLRRKIERIPSEPQDHQNCARCRLRFLNRRQEILSACFRRKRRLKLLCSLQCARHLPFAEPLLGQRAVAPSCAA